MPGTRTLRDDGSIQATLVNAGVLPHPVTGERVVGLVTAGRHKLRNLRADPRAPSPGLVHAPIADAEHHRSGGAGDRGAKSGVDPARMRIARVAPIDLDEVRAPPGHRPGVLLEVPGAAGALGARPPQPGEEEG